MIRNSLFISSTALILIVFALMKRLAFLAAYKRILFVYCGGSMALFFAVLGVNLFAAALAINRKILLKDTGRKLSHLDNQMQMGTDEPLPPFIAGRR